jgi:WD40 repeat protein
MTNDQDSFLCDELGHVHKFNTTREDFVDDLLITPADRVQKGKILNSHANPMLGSMIQFRGMDKFLIFECPPPKRGLSERAPAQVSASHKHDVELEGGMIGLWLPSTTITKVVDFVGHEDAIVGFGLFGQDDEPTTTSSVNKRKEKTEDDPETTSIKSASSSLQGDDEDGEKMESTAELKNRLLEEADTSEEMKKLTASAHAVMRGGESYMKASKEEASFFSVSTDHTIRCWDEWDGKESYQFRSKSKSEVTTTCMLWSMNTIATGHESGMLALWNADAGTSVCSTVLKAPIMSLIESKNSRSHYLVGADFSGKIAVYNLQAYVANPSTVIVETTINSRHDKLDPSIMSLTYHALSDSYFTGGTDFSVNGFRIGSETTNHFKDSGHGPLREGVMSLKCTKNYLVSGGEIGNIILWHIIPDQRTSATLSPLPTLVPMLKWFSTTPELRLPAILDFKELDNRRLFLCQTGVNYRGKYEDETGTRVWKIWLQPRQTTSATILMSYDALESDARKVSIADLSAKMRSKASVPPTLASIDSTLATHSKPAMPSRRMTHSRLSLTPQSAPIRLEDQPSRPGELFRVMGEQNEGMYISAQQMHYFKHGEYQINHVKMKCDESHSQLQSLYFGTESGVICRHDHVIRKERGED